MTETTQTTKEVIEVVTTALQPLAEKLGTTAQYVWGLQVKQAYVDGSIALVVLLFGIALITVAILWMKKINDNLETQRNTEMDGFGVVASVILFIAGFIFLCTNVPTVLNCFINPEHYALHQLIKLVK